MFFIVGRITSLSSNNLKRAILLCAICTLFPASSALAEQAKFVDQKKLLDWCTSNKADYLNRCDGYIMAIADSISVFNTALLNKAEGACIPNDLSNHKLRDVVVDFLSKNPNFANDANFSVFFAIDAAWRRCN